MTWLRRGLPPIWCSTLGRPDLRRVPLPAAMMTTASFRFESTSLLSIHGLRLSLVASPPLIQRIRHGKGGAASICGNCRPVGWLLLRRGGIPSRWARLRNGDVDVLHRPHFQLVQSWLDFRSVAHNQDSVLFGLNVFLRHTIQVGQGHFFKGGFVCDEIVRGVAVEFETFAFGEDLVFGVVAEKERTEQVVFAAVQFLPGEGPGGKPGNLCHCSLGCFHSGRALGYDDNAEGCRVVVSKREAAAYFIGQSHFGADFLEKTAGKDAAEDLVHDGESRNVGVTAVSAHAYDLHVGLIDVFLVNEEDTWLGPGKGVVAGGRGLSRWQTFKCRTELGFHGYGVEVATDADDELATDGAIMQGLQVVEGDGANGGEFRLTGVGTIGSVGQLFPFAFGDGRFVVVAANDAGGFLLLGELKLFRAPLGM